MCSTSRPGPGSIRRARAPPFCTPRGSGFSSCRGMCCAPAAAACWTRARRSRGVNKEEYDCALCAAGYQPTLDEMVEVTFTVSRRVRRIAAHDPDELPFAEYFRQIFWGSGIDVPDNFEQLIEEIVLDAIELPPGEKALLSL